ncbi:MAG: hypothetical protein ABIV94_04880, partial [Acidimicrobiales bacterium]
PVFRGRRVRLLDALGVAAMMLAGVVGGATAVDAEGESFVVVPGLIGVVGMLLALFSWNDFCPVCRVDGRYLVGRTITGIRRIDVTRSTRFAAYRVKGRWQLRVAGPDGAISLPARVTLAPELVRAAIVARPSEVAITRGTARFLDLPPDLTRRVRGGRFYLTTFGAMALLVASGLLSAAVVEFW